MEENVKTNKELMYDLLQSRDREKFLSLLDNSLGEQDALDFKKEWIDYQNLAKIMLGMANIGGGMIVVGVEEKEDKTLNPVGLKSICDKADVQNKIDKYLPENLKFRVDDYDFTGESYSKIKNKLYQVVSISSDDKNLPYILTKGMEKDEEGVIFVRRGTKSVRANTEEIKNMISKRTETLLMDKSSLELEEHLKQLYILYENKKTEKNLLGSGISNSILLSLGFDVNNKELMKKEYNQTLEYFINKKKEKIESVLDLS